MSRKHISVYLHLIWSTWDREDRILPSIERRVHRMIVSSIKNLGCTTLAINGRPDHIQLMIKFTTNITIAEVVKRAKGTSSRLINKNSMINGHFQWRPGYGAFSVSRWDTDKVLNYIRNHKEHHQQRNLIAGLETLPNRNDARRQPVRRLQSGPRTHPCLSLRGGSSLPPW